MVIRDMEFPVDYKNIKTIRIIYTPESSIEKEFIKEFFTFIGCFVSGTLVENMPKKATDEHDVDLIVVSSRSHLTDLAPLFLNLSVKFPKRRVRAVACDINNRTISANNCTEQKYDSALYSARDFMNNVIRNVIEQIWDRDEESEIRDSLYNISEWYNEYDFFAMLQIKSTFNVARLSEVVEYNNQKKYDIPCSPYIDTMLRCFYRFSDVIIQNNDVYSIYARVNAANNIRDIYTSIPEESDCRKKKKIPMPLAKELLSELNSIYKIDPDYIGAYRLAVSICENDPQLRISAYNYLRRGYHYAGKTNDKCFGYWDYLMGLYEMKLFGKNERAIIYFKEAEGINPSDYKAIFHTAMCYIGFKNYHAAIDELQKAYRLLAKGRSLRVFYEDVTHNTENDNNSLYCNGYNGWDCVPLNECLYMYRTYIYMARISSLCNNQIICRDYIRYAFSAATAYWGAPTLKKCLSESTWHNVYIENAYGLPARALFVTLKRVMCSTRCIINY